MCWVANTSWLPLLSCGRVSVGYMWCCYVPVKSKSLRIWCICIFLEVACGELKCVSWRRIISMLCRRDMDMYIEHSGAEAWLFRANQSNAVAADVRGIYYIQDVNFTRKEFWSGKCIHYISVCVCVCVRVCSSVRMPRSECGVRDLSEWNEHVMGYLSVRIS